MASHVEYKIIEDITHAKYTNLYYINSKFYYLTTVKFEDINLKPIKTLGGPEHTQRISLQEYNLNPIIKYFSNNEELNTYVNSLEIKELTNPTLHFSHYYEHNIAHGLYDALYPIYLCYLNFYNDHEYDSFNMFLNVLVDPGGWHMPEKYIATREWVINIFKDFCKGGDLILKKNTNYNIKFNTLVVGAWHAGISFVNKKFIMPGKNIFALEKYRNRFQKAYDIVAPIKNNIVKIIVVNSDRYTEDERRNLIRLVVEYSKNENIKINFINWKDHPNFKNQLQIMNDCDIHISGAGTSMLNFPFLNDNSININLGVKSFCSKMPKPSLMETNICLLSNQICCEFYDIYKYKEILYNETKIIIEKCINNLHNRIYLQSKMPNYIKLWQSLCDNYPEETEELILRLRGEAYPCLIFYRFPDFIIYRYIDIYQRFLNRLKK